MKQAHAMGEEARRAAQQEQDKLRKEIGDLMAKLAKVQASYTSSIRPHTLGNRGLDGQARKGAAATC